MIIGAAAFMIVYQHNMNEILILNDTLRREKKELEDKIRDLEKYKDDRNVITSVVVDVESNPDGEAISKVAENQIIERVKETLGVFKGKPVSFLADANTSQVSRALFGKRRLSGIHDRDYIVEIKTMIVIFGELKVRIAVQEWKDSVAERKE